MIPRGCTCTAYYDFPFKENDVDTLFVTYEQANKIVFEKSIDDCTFLDGEIEVKLEQEDTILLEEKIRIRMQIRGKLNDGSAFKSDVVEASTDELIKEGVI